MIGARDPFGFAVSLWLCARVCVCGGGGGASVCVRACMHDCMGICATVWVTNNTQSLSHTRARAQYCTLTRRHVICGQRQGGLPHDDERTTDDLFVLMTHTHAHTCTCSRAHLHAHTLCLWEDWTPNDTVEQFCPLPPLSSAHTINISINKPIY